jgi:hypothetical protein
MKHDGHVLQGAASNYGILMRKLHANVGKSVALEYGPSFAHPSFSLPHEVTLTPEVI